MNQKLITTLSAYQKIILVGGGTGGHIQPIVSIVRAFREEKIDIVTQPEFLWIGGAHSHEEHAARDENIPFQSIPTLKLSTTKSFKVLLYPWFLLLGFLQTRKILKTIKKYGKTRDSDKFFACKFCISVREYFRKKFQTVGPRGSLERGSFGNLENRSEDRYQNEAKKKETFGTFGHKSTEKTESAKTAGSIKNMVAFSKGGPGSVAIGIAAWSLRIPLYIHESDTIPGRSNRILSRFADQVFLGFESAKKYFKNVPSEVIGQILDPIFYHPTILPSYHPRITWKTDKPHILVMCGSQGSRAIFEAIIDQFTQNEAYEWIIGLGVLNQNMASDFEKIPHAQGVSWIGQEDIAYLVQDADIAITRGSATTLAELTAFLQKPTLIMIPLPYSANNHQYHNAQEYEKMGHILLEQKNISQLGTIITQYV